MGIKRKQAARSPPPFPNHDISVSISTLPHNQRFTNHRSRYASEALRGCGEVVAAAVAQAGLALKFASDCLREDRDIVLAAVEQDG